MKDGLEIIWSQHARFQLQERLIPKSEVEKCLRKPQKTVQQSEFRFRGLRMVKKNRKRYLLVVIYEKKGSKLKVITAFYTSKIKKYL